MKRTNQHRNESPPFWSNQLYDISVLDFLFTLRSSSHFVLCLSLSVFFCWKKKRIITIILDIVIMFVISYKPHLLEHGSVVSSNAVCRMDAIKSAISKKKNWIEMNEHKPTNEQIEPQKMCNVFKLSSNNGAKNGGQKVAGFSIRKKWHRKAAIKKRCPSAKVHAWLLLWES